MTDESKKKVLIVDDDPAILFLLVKILHIFLPKSQKFTAHNKKEALMLLEERIFDIVISDFSLPDGDGTAILSHPRVQGKKIGISGQAPNEFRALCDEFIAKPFNVRDFAMILQPRL